MPNLLVNAMLLLAVGALSCGVGAQTTYRCGNTYSQMPCPGGVIIDTTDQRTKTQKAQADKTASRDARSADAMQKARLQQEAKDLANNAPTDLSTAPAKAKASAPDTSQLKKKKRKTPEFFTAQVPGDKKKKPVTKKIGAPDVSKP